MHFMLKLLKLTENSQNFIMFYNIVIKIITNGDFMRKFIKIISSLFLALFLFINCGCASDSSESPNSSGTGNSTAVTQWDNTPKVLTPVASGVTILGNSSVTIDTSNSYDGYIMVMYTGSASKIKFLITTPDNVKYTYDLLPSSEYSTLPLTGGDGTYTIQAMEHVIDNKYSTLYTSTIDITLTSEFAPFLYPNQYTWFSPESVAVQKASELTSSSTDALSAIEQIYNYVIENITYDTVKAKTVTSSYLPDVDNTLISGSGICFDYAALMTAMLRSQGIPTKLEIGYSGEMYHAWISTYSDKTGWINNVIHFNGQDWSLMDPTLAASNSSQTVKSYVGDGSNYTVKYSR